MKVERGSRMAHTKTRHRCSVPRIVRAVWDARLRIRKTRIRILHPEGVQLIRMGSKLSTMATWPIRGVRCSKRSVRMNNNTVPSRARTASLRYIERRKLSTRSFSGTKLCTMRWSVEILPRAVGILLRRD